MISTDWFLEGVHFLGERHPARSVGYKALARATSDLAAMGAAPLYFFLTLALPSARTGEWLHEFSRGMAQAARKFGMRLLGGDLSQQKTVAISLTVIGEVPSGEAVTRAGAKPGDSVYVSGKLGAAQLGLETFLRGRRPRLPWARAALSAHLYPQPRLALGRWLARRHITTAMIDLSDGLSTDLARLCRASQAGAEIAECSLPLALLPSTGSAGKPAALKRALHGGEDYELLFTVPARLTRRIPARFDRITLTRIGKITARRKILLMDATGHARPLLPGGWDPFARRR